MQLLDVTLFCSRVKHQTSVSASIEKKLISVTVEVDTLRFQIYYYGTCDSEDGHGDLEYEALVIADNTMGISYDRKENNLA